MLGIQNPGFLLQWRSSWRPETIGPSGAPVHGQLCSPTPLPFLLPVEGYNRPDVMGPATVASHLVSLHMAIVLQIVTSPNTSQIFSNLSISTLSC